MTQATPSRAGRPRAVVLCEGPGGLGAVRALNRHGVATTAIAFDRRAPVLWSRFPARKILVEVDEPEMLEERLHAALRELRGGRPVLVPSSDRTASFMVKNRDDLARDFAFCLPDGNLVDLLNDKAEETRLIADLGVPIPKTVRAFPASPQELEAQLGQPIVIKPRSFKHRHRLRPKTAVLRTRADTKAFYEQHRDELDGFIAQEVVPGADDTLWLCSGTFNHRHELVEGLVKRKIRMSPPHFGVCSFAISASNPTVLELAAKVGKGLRYTGHAALEFKWDLRDGLYKYIELNPRTPASVALDEASGVPTVWNTYRVALGEEVEPAPSRQRDGVVYLIPLEDMYHRMKDGERLPAILLHYLRYAFHKRVGPHFAWNDPLPGFVDAWTFVRGLAESRRRRWRAWRAPSAGDSR